MSRLFSIIIPSYNQQDYLPSAIESALEQPQSEVIVVDDGSTDNSLEIAKKYKEHGARVISQVNKGLASARNTGIMNANGDWILPLDADDILLDNCIDKIADKISHEQADVVGLSFKEFGLSQAKVILIPNPTLEDFKLGNRLGYCSAIRKSALLAVGGYSPRMIYGYEDLHLWINLLKRGYVFTTIPEITWLYRIKENSMIHDAQAHHEELMAQIARDFPDLRLNF